MVGALYKHKKKKNEKEEKQVYPPNKRFRRSDLLPALTFTATKDRKDAVSCV